MPGNQARPALEEILQTLRSYLPEFHRRYHVKSLGVFGSYARGEQRKRSDLDILVEYEETPTLLQMAALQREMSHIVGIQVDLVLKRTLRPAFAGRILSEVIYL
ncbi:MAG: DNA polymerase beta [Chloroflexi bacterium]|nr:DNA polymerase beta [Chloroflexota bacterium]